jgi:hypothetical protein
VVLCKVAAWRACVRLLRYCGRLEAVAQALLSLCSARRKAEGNYGIVLGNTNHAGRISTAVLDVWAALLKQLPQAMLVLRQASRASVQWLSKLWVFHGNCCFCHCNLCSQATQKQ